MKYLYKYPQAAFPYTQLVAENHQRDRSSPEFELNYFYLTQSRRGAKEEDKEDR